MAADTAGLSLSFSRNGGGKMRQNTKKAIPLIAAACVAAIAAAAFFLFHQNAAEWEPLPQVHAGVSSREITKITLRKTIDSAEWVVFDDSDLTAQWADFLEKAKVRREGRALDPDNVNGGGPAAAVIQTGTSELAIYWEESTGECSLQTGGVQYAVKSTVRIPFLQTYDAAAERHGLTSPWD